MILSILAPIALAGDPVPDVSGCWQNDLGSQMQIESQASTNSIKGMYWTAVGNVSQDRANPLVGVQNGDVVGFCVQWRPSEGEKLSVTCFTGQVTKREDGEHLVTTWILNRDFADDQEANNLWSANLVGSNDFKRGERACK